MKNKKVLAIVSTILIVVGVSICFGVAIFSNQDVEVRIERAGVCNPLKPVKDKEVKTDEDTKKQLAKYWKKTDKEEAQHEKNHKYSLYLEAQLFLVLCNPQMRYHLMLSLLPE